MITFLLWLMMGLATIGTIGSVVQEKAVSSVVGVLHVIFFTYLALHWAAGTCG